MRGRVLLLAVVVVSTLGACKSSGRHRPAAAREGLSGGVLVFEDDFEREALGDRWMNRSGRWHIARAGREGRVGVQGDRNEGLWLDFALPERVRIEFDARAGSDEGDLKCEVFAPEPRHQAGYVVILGGWSNTVSVIARLDEHGEDRLESPARAEKGRTHHWTLIRVSDTLRWYVDGTLVLEYHDEDPLRGRYFGFNDWNAPVEFDNLKIFEL